MHEDAAATTDVEFTDEETRWLEQNPTIVMGYNPDWAPYEYIDEDGILSGVSAAIAERFEEISGAQFVQADGIEVWDDNLIGIRNGSIDVLFTSWAERSPQRESFMDFTETWYYIPTDIIVKKSDIGKINPDNWYQYKVVIATGYSVDVWLEENAPELVYITADTPLEALEMVSDGRADVYLEPWDGANHRAIANGITGLADAGPLGDNFEVTIGYAEGNVVFGSIMQKMLDALEDEKQQIISDAINRSFAALRSMPMCR